MEMQDRGQRLLDWCLMGSPANLLDPKTEVIGCQVGDVPSWRRAKFYSTVRLLLSLAAVGRGLPADEGFLRLWHRHCVASLEDERLPCCRIPAGRWKTQAHHHGLRAFQPPVARDSGRTQKETLVQPPVCSCSTAFLHALVDISASANARSPWLPSGSMRRPILL